MAKNPSPTAPSEYTYIDHNRLNSYVEQIRGSTKKNSRVKWELKLGMTGPQVGTGTEIDSVEMNDHEKMMFLVEYLSDNGLLGRDRFSNKDFVYTDMEAEKLVFNFPENTDFYNLKSISIWISFESFDRCVFDYSYGYPNESHLGHKTYTDGIYLYLIEQYWSGDRAQSTTLSGYSALCWLAINLHKLQLIGDKKARECGADGEDPLLTDPGGNYVSALIPNYHFMASPWDPTPVQDNYGVFDSHFVGIEPREVLLRLGAVPTGSRRIRSLYRVRYFTDEQFYAGKGYEARACDVAAYPIFVEAI